MSFEESVQLKLEERHQPISDEQYERVLNLAQHDDDGCANEEWLEARKMVITGSKVSGCVGNGYTNPKSTLQSLIWPSEFKQSDATAWGNFYEDECEDTFLVWLQSRVDDDYDELVDFQLHEPKGLAINKNAPWQGYSPDGIIDLLYKDGSRETALCEYKCPYSLREKKPSVHDTWYEELCLPLSTSSRVMPNGNRRRKRKAALAHEAQETVDIKNYYYDQIQWGANLLEELKVLTPRHAHASINIYFVVWTPHATKIQLIQSSKEYYEEFLKKEALNFYNEQYIPNIVRQELGMLEQNEVVWV